MSVEAAESTRRPAEASAARPAGVAARPSKPVLVWAGVGLVLLIVIAQALVRWVTGDGFRGADPGPDSYDGTRSLGAHALEWGLFLSALVVIWHFGVRSVRRERRLTFDGMLVVAACLSGFWEACTSYVAPAHAYNAHLINLGSWAQYIPGWHAANGEAVVTPLVLVFGMYIWFVAGFPILGCWLIRRLRDLRPRLSTLSAFSLFFLFGAALTAGFEQLILHSQVYVYPEVPHAISLWDGTLHQYPLLSAVGGGGVLTMITALRYTAQDGDALALRGSEHLSARLRPVVSTVAVVGFTHLAVIACWMIPFNLFVGVEADTSVNVPSYLDHGFVSGNR
ncbi:spirocyclase AveC family protein [Sporichthya brevicatena]|uniref:Spirocyclase AveC family protein n=1 Tax=Sporichthya brevicatena TaxID=171442 RepID=A0ABP3S6U6_9ACTN